MIVFIATVLVAAIAAGVLIDTSGKLQERSSRTGQEATDQVSSNVHVLAILGRRDTTSNTGIKDLDILVSLAPGASDVDLSQMRIQLSNATQLRTFNHSSAGAAGINEFITNDVRDADNSFTSSSPVLTSGDLANISIALDTNSLEFEPRMHVNVLLLPEVGSSIEAGFTTPNSYGTKLILEMR